MPSYHILATQTLGDICAWEGGKGQWWMKAHGQRVEGKNKQTKTNKILTVKEDCGEMWPLDDNVAVEEEVGQAYLYIFIFFLKKAMQSQYQTWHWMISQTSQKCKVHFKTSTSRLTSQTAGTLKEATARGLADAVYLLWATFRKRHLYWACALWRIVAAQGWRPPAWPDSQGSSRRRGRRRERKKRAGRKWKDNQRRKN